jgi:uncharacterized protein YbjT (DUF2867 family)
MNQAHGKLNVAIAGASGFVGVHLMKSIGDVHHLIALSRSEPKDLPEDTEWRETDLFSSGSSMKALKGADIAIYLVHSMLPSSRLFQGSFSETDLLLADNFARACLKNGVKQIIYLGGLVPSGQTSQHLQSRKDVEDVFTETGIPCTVLRAGMVVGQGGSSFEILRNLVLKLPIMLLPAWTKRRTQAIYIDDLVRILSVAVGNSAFYSQTLDAVTGEKMLYSDFIRITAQELHKKRLLIPFPLDATALSKYWVALFGKTHYELVSPLIESLLCDLPQHPPGVLVAPLIQVPKFEDMVKLTVAQPPLPKPEGSSQGKPAKRINNVRSIQKLPSRPDVNCAWIAREYAHWLTTFFKTLIRVKIDQEHQLVHFMMVWIPKPLLTLKYLPENFDDNQQTFDIVGGILTNPSRTGWFEFRQICNKRFTISAIHEYVPSLPWYLYMVSQAQIHGFVMKAFGRHLRVKAANKTQHELKKPAPAT